MPKRVLMTASVPSMIGQFNMDNIRILQELGYEVDVATDFNDTSVWPMERVESFKHALSDLHVRCEQVDFSRNPLDLGRMVRSYRHAVALLRRETYAFVHTHTPVASAIMRVAAHRTGTRVIYTAHGFHFYDGAPLRNWLLYYPVERFLSRWTDVLVTINKEDYERARRSFHAGRVEYVPGVGVDTEKFRPRASGRERIRKELGLSETDTMLLSVGELNENKNHASVIRAVQGLDLTYVVVGKGDKADELARLAEERGVDLRLMGFREDVADFYDAADAYVLPSIREGLNVSLMEAMASGLPVSCGRIRGNVDLIDPADNTLFNPMDDCDTKRAIVNALGRASELGRKNIEAIQGFDVANVAGSVSEIYGGGYCHLQFLLMRQQKRHDIGIPLNAKLLISVGELSARKNHEVVVKALQELPDNYWYAIVGKGELKEYLASLDKTGRLQLLGYRDDVRELLWTSDLFVFPSRQEGLPVALMEAIATGLPSIVSDIRGNRDLLGHGIDPHEVHRWSKAIKEGGKHGNVDAYSFHAVRNRMSELYESV